MGHLIREVDLASDAELRAFHDVYVRAETQDGRPWTHPMALAELVQELREPAPTEWYEGFVALDGDRVVGVLRLGYFEGSDLDKIWLEVYVDPAERRKRVGTALVDRALERAREQGRPTVITDTTYAWEQREDAPARRFIEGLGFSLANLEILRTLQLPVADALLEEMEADAAPHHEGYQLLTYTGEMPEELQQSWCDVVNRLAVDAPGGDIAWDISASTPATYREGTTRLAQVGRTRLGALALQDGQVVAETHIVVTEDDPEAEQWSTIVAPQHRGHRLGAVVKVANLRLLRAVRPDVTRVVTQNAETNAFMVSINERLGFQITALCPEFVRRL
jgi:GNAT superfamily N-acetyltransferase